MEEAKKNVYHVAYHFKNDRGSGIGSTTIFIDKEMNSSKTIKEVQNFISDFDEVKGHVVILNWIRLEQESIS